MEKISYTINYLFQKLFDTEIHPFFYDLRRIEYKYNKDFINFRKKMIKNKISYQKTILPKPVKLKKKKRKY